jgi:hypothetical protein
MSMTHDPNHTRHSAASQPNGHQPHPTDMTAFEGDPAFEQRVEGTHASAPRADEAGRASDDALMRCYNG